jgi:hypothetical protein
VAVLLSWAKKLFWPASPKLRTNAAWRYECKSSAADTVSDGQRRAGALAAREGLEVEPLIRKAGLTSQHVENSKFPINVKSQIAFLNLVAAAAGDELLGISSCAEFRSS